MELTKKREEFHKRIRQSYHEKQFAIERIKLCRVSLYDQRPSFEFLTEWGKKQIRKRRNKGIKDFYSGYEFGLIVQSRFYWPTGYHQKEKAYGYQREQNYAILGRVF